MKSVLSGFYALPPKFATTSTLHADRCIHQHLLLAKKPILSTGKFLKKQRNDRIGSAKCALNLLLLDEIFFNLLSASAKCILDGIELLDKIINAKADSRSVIRDELGDLKEQDADENTHEFIRTMNQSFITPLERDDR